MQEVILSSIVAMGLSGTPEIPPRHPRTINRQSSLQNRIGRLKHRANAKRSSNNTEIEVDLIEALEGFESSFELVEAPEIEIKLEPLTRYRGLDVTEEAIAAILDESNHLIGGQLDPAKITNVQQTVTQPFLVQRGIREVIGVGVTDFSGSTPARVQNIKATIEKFDGQIIERGAQFSFNKTLNDVRPENGFLKEKIIKNGEDVYEYGGGVCQVSTTLFRAALTAGMPYPQRWSHSYAVSYYNPEGLDATIYLGGKDLVIENDTPGDVLMKMFIYDNKFITVFYGTRGDRNVSLELTHFWLGEHNKMSVNWRRTIEEDGEISEGDLRSEYKPRVQE